MKLVLFDIDGTLLWSDGAGRRALQRALSDVFGSTGPADHWFDGKTDPQIVRELMRHDGHEDAKIDGEMATLLNLYVGHLRVELADHTHHARVMPGVNDLLDALQRRDDVILGLLTGNIVLGARAKLEAVRIDVSRFTVGAYGSDHELRTELPGIARTRARDLAAVDIAGSDVVVIGDTPSDITCGRAIGARAIGVATGRYSAEQLAAYEPHAVFSDLTATDAVVHAIIE